MTTWKCECANVNPETIKVCLCCKKEKPKESGLFHLACEIVKDQWKKKHGNRHS